MLKRLWEKQNEKFLNSAHPKRQYYFYYTVLFALMCLVVFFWYLEEGRTFVWDPDGWRQHYKALIYYGQYLRQIIKTLLFEHRLDIPEWNFAMGEGNDIMQTLHFYWLGNPFALFSVFFTSSNMYIYLAVICIALLYFAGIAFSNFFFYLNKKASRYSVMAGAMVYVFCLWGIFNPGRHPFYLNPLVYFPLVLLGVEKIIRKQRPYTFILAVFISAVTNFYFFYMIAALTVVYVCIRLIHEGVKQKNIRKQLQALLKIGGSAILGCIMAGAILFPIIYCFLGDARFSASVKVDPFYYFGYYTAIIGGFVSTSATGWTCLGFSAPVILAVFLLFFQKKKNSTLKIFFAVGTLFIIFPVFGHILNGFSYVTNRWIWAFALLVAYIFAIMWKDLLNLSPRAWKILAICLIAYFAVCLWFTYSKTIGVFGSIIIACVFLFLVAPLSEKKYDTAAKSRRQFACLLVVLAGIGWNSYILMAPLNSDSYAAQSIEADTITEKLNTNETVAIAAAAEEENVTEYYRYTGPSLEENANLISGISSTQYYWTISNPYINLFRRAMELCSSRSYHYQTYEDRSELLALSSVRYYVAPESNTDAVPYGFTYLNTYDITAEKTEDMLEDLGKELGETLTEDQVAVAQLLTSKKYKVYRNDNYLPVGYAYDYALSEDSWDNLNAVQKQDALLQGVVLSDYAGETHDEALSLTSQEVDYEMTLSSPDLTYEDGKFVVTASGVSATLTFAGLPNSETYLSIEGLDFEGTPAYDLYLGDEDVDPLNLYTETRWNLLSDDQQYNMKIEKLYWTSRNPKYVNLPITPSTGGAKNLEYLTERHTYYNNVHDCTLHFDYTEEPLTSITITFPSIGVYSVEDMHVICQPMDGFSEKVSKLKENVLQNVQVGEDTVTGTISLSEPKILCLSIPYSKGWTAYVDGVETTLYQANIKNMAVELTAGDHQVTVVYHTPLLRVGVLASVVGFAIFILLVLLIEKQRREKRRCRQRLVRK